MIRNIRCAISASVLAAALSSCANAPQPSPAAIPVVTHPTPICSGKVACEQMWLRANTYVQMASGMKVLTNNDQVIQTYPANAIGRMTGTVTKYPLTETDYEIRLALECRRYENCSDLAARGTSLFNMSVAGPQLTPPLQPPQ